ncbi:MAG TPA: HEAT repeat domain-containing protein [Pirellulaceae bacterium]|nr:HEAT repeat domain-containing protein [Pirellulaceae bacterium]
MNPPNAVDESPPPLRSADSQLPPVEAPTASFILQLFLIPLLIVSIVVLLWLLFSWMAHLGRDNPDALLRRLENFDDNSWQAAKELADVLRSPDPKYDELRADRDLAARLAGMLASDMKTPATGQGKKARAQRRMFLCRALGMFHVTEGLPVLLECASQERDLVEAEVRLSAIEAIATLADRLGPEKIRGEKNVLPTLLAASRASDADEPPPPSSDDEPAVYRPHAEVRAVSAYTLGIVGGDEALARLAAMLGDTYPAARYNAATGLARQGDVRAIRVIKEMLAANNPLAAKDERYPVDQDRKRAAVLLAGIQASLKLHEENPTADLSPLGAALDQLASADLTHIKSDSVKLQSAAREARQILGKRP